MYELMLYGIALVFSTVPYQAEDSCCQITFHKTVRLAYVALRVADSKFWFAFLAGAPYQVCFPMPFV